MYKIIETGVEFPSNELHSRFPNVSLPATLSQGDLDHLGLEFIPDPEPTAEELAAIAEAERQASIPQVVDMRQARLALLDAGMLDLVDAAIAAQDEPFKSRAKVEWEFATQVRRDWPTLVALRAAVGLTERQMDDLFVEAAKL